MAEVFTADNNGVGAAAPILVGGYYPSIDQQMINGLGLNIPWGGGSNQRISVSPVGGVSLEPQSDMNRLLDIMAVAMPTGDVINYSFEGLVGPQGIPGPPGPPAVGAVAAGLEYDFGTAIPSSEPTVDVPTTNGITFSQSGSNVTWTTGTLRYKGIDYTIAVEATGDTNKYIYWDLNSLNTTLKTTNTLGDATGTDRWVMCYNDSGVPYPSASNKVLHGGLVQASTITATQILANTLTANEIFANTITFDELRQTGGSEAVDTSAMRDDSTTLVASTETAAEVEATSDTTWTDLAAVTLTTTGLPVQVTCSCELKGDASGVYKADLRIYDGSASIIAQVVLLDTGGAYRGYNIFTIDTPSSGSHTYTLQTKKVSSGADLYAQLRKTVGYSFLK